MINTSNNDAKNENLILNSKPGDETLVQTIRFSDKARSGRDWTEAPQDSNECFHSDSIEVTNLLHLWAALVGTLGGKLIRLLLLEQKCCPVPRQHLIMVTIMMMPHYST